MRPPTDYVLRWMLNPPGLTQEETVRLNSLARRVRELEMRGITEITIEIKRHEQEVRE